MYLWRMDKVVVLVQMCHYFLEIFFKENYLLTFSLLRMSRNALSLPFTYQLGVNLSLDEGYFDMKVNEGRNFK